MEKAKPPGRILYPAWGLCYIFKLMQFKSWSSNTPQVPKPLSAGCSAVKSAQCLGSEPVRYELSLSELQLPAKASKHQSNPCSSHNRGFCLAVSASESMPDNLRPLSADLQSVTRTIVRRMDWSRLDDSPPFGRIVWRVEEPRWNYRHGQIRTRWNRHLPGNTDYCPSLPWPSAQACQRTYTAKKSG